MTVTVRTQLYEMEWCDTASVSGFFLIEVHIIVHVSGTNLD